MATIAEILSRKWPGMQWSINEDDYSSLKWADSNIQPKPSKEEILAKSAEVDIEIDAERRAVMRRDALLENIDFLFVALEVLTSAVDELQTLQPLATRASQVDILKTKLSEIRSKVV